MQFFDFSLKRFFQQTLVATLGLGVFFPVAAVAVEIVESTASSTFTLNVDAGNLNQDFGTVHIQSDSAGWILLVRSTQGSTLSHSNHPSAVPYTLTVDGIQVNSLTGGNDVVALTTSTLSCPPPVGCTLPVRATILASDTDGKPSGSYSDTLVFTLINQ